MHFLYALGLGILIGGANGWLWKGWIRRIFSSSNLKVAVALFGILKFGILIALFWLLLAIVKVDPLGLLVGFTIATFVFAIRIGLKWKQGHISQHML